jgi:hypothetical protein
MKRLTLLIAFVVSFVFGMLMPLTHTHAQTNPPKRMYFTVDYMKTKPGKNPEKMEHELWKPVHAQMKKDGVIRSWSVMEPRFGGSEAYDYITVTGFNNLADVEKEQDAYEAAFKKVWPNRNLEEIVKTTFDARDETRSELFVVADSLDSSDQ